MRVFLRRMDLRQHRKMVMIDNYIAYTGSMNMVDPRYFKQDSGVGRWIDLMARMEGPVATSMGIVYSCDWGNRDRQAHSAAAAGRQYHAVRRGQRTYYSHDRLRTGLSGRSDSSGSPHRRLCGERASDHDHPYFVPSDDLLHAICTAAQRGVDVSIILPRKNDSLLGRLGQPGLLHRAAGGRGQNLSV